MKTTAIAVAGLLAASVAAADNLEGVERMICSAGQTQICLENDTCYSASAAELAIPDFVVIDTKKKLVATTKSSGENRSTEFSRINKADGLIYLQGFEGNRAFSFVIHVATGRMTVAVARDGISVSVFGACTDADI